MSKKFNLLGKHIETLDISFEVKRYYSPDKFDKMRDIYIGLRKHFNHTDL